MNIIINALMSCPHGSSATCGIFLIIKKKRIKKKEILGVRELAYCNKNIMKSAISSIKNSGSAHHCCGKTSGNGN